MSAAEATAEVFVTAFKSLKPRQREAILEQMLADDELSADFADTLTLESRRHQSRRSFHWNKGFRSPRPASDDLAATRQLTNQFDAKEWKW